MVKETWKGLQRSSSVARVHVRDLIVSNRQEYFSLNRLHFVCLIYLLESAIKGGDYFTNKN